MKKSLLYILATALLVACTSENDLSSLSVGELKAAQQKPQTPVTFGSYLARQAVTRSSIDGAADLLAEGGFGVFAYYTADEVYGPSAKPHFMYNIKVNSSDAGATWTYSPMKYWPAEDLSSDNHSTIRTRIDRLSFLAYAPYVAVDDNGVPVNGKTKGITKIEPGKHTGRGDVKITYVASTAADSDDLMWGVAKNTTTWTGADGVTTNVEAGSPFLNLTRPTEEKNVDFFFKHALSRLGATVRIANNQLTAGGDALWSDANLAAAKTKVLIEKVVIKRDIYSHGVLNLNSSGEPNWEDTGSHTPGQFVIDLTNGLDPALAYSDTATTVAYQPVGVTTDAAKSLLGMHNGRHDYFMLIPEDATAAPSDTEIEITYHIMTEDAKLDDGFIDMKNTIRKTVPTAAMQRAKNYTLNIVIGLSSLDMDVDVTIDSWTDESDVNVATAP